MELISKDTAIRVVDSGRNRQQLVDMMRAVPPVNAIEIPDGATIGDMLTAMFPNLREIEMVLENEEGEEFQVNYDLTQDVSFGWDAPYKAESEG